MIRTALRPLALVATLLLLAVAGCSGGAPSGPTVITMWMYPVIKDAAAGQTFWNDTAADFNAAHPDIELRVEMQTFAKRDEQVTAALAAGKGPDIVLLTPDQVATYHGINGLLPVDAAVADTRGSFLEPALAAGSIGDELYGIPLFQNINTTVYNTELFEQAGLELPKTWDDVRAAAPVLAARGIAVTDYTGSPEQTLNLTFYPLLWQAGATIFTEDGTDIAFDSPEGISALQFLVDLQQAKGLPVDSATAAPGIEGSPLAQGKVAMRITTSLTDAQQLRTALGEQSMTIGAPLTGAVQATYGNPGMLALTSINRSDSREAAQQVLAHLTSAEVQTGLNELAGTFPTRTDVTIDESDPDVAAFAEALPYANAGEASPASRQVMTVLAPYVQAALRGDLSAADAMTQAAAEARGVLQRS